MEHSFDERRRVLSLTILERYSPRFGNGQDVVRERRIEIRPHSVGLRVESKYPVAWRDKSASIVPGEYTIAEVSAFIAGMIKIEAVVVSDLLLETELWYDRGFLRSEKNFPREIFEKVPLSEFVRGSLKSYKQWVRRVVCSGPAFYGVSPQRIERNIRDGVYPEKLHSVKHWARLEFDDLRFVIRYQVWRHPSWGVFVSQYYPMYRDILRRHPESWQEAGAFIGAVLKFPKTDRVRDLVDRVYNEGGSMLRAVRCRSAREVAAYLQVLAEQRANEAFKVTLFEYRPPDIEVPPGWKLADKTTFWTLGDKFNCCINRNGNYSSRVKSGDAVVAFHDQHIGTDGGALAFFIRDAGKWKLQEIGAWSNRLVLSEYRAQADVIVTALRLWERKREEEHESELRERRRRYDRELLQRAREGGRRDRPLHFPRCVRGATEHPPVHALIHPPMRLLYAGLR
jgi:hypothetical protein